MEHLMTRVVNTEHLLTVLSNEDKVKIGNYIDAYAGIGGKPHVEIDYLLREWAEQKESLFNILGQKLIVSKEVQFKKDIDEIAREIGREKATASNIMADFCYDYTSRVQEFFPHFANPCRSALFELVDNWALASNVYSGETIEIPNPVNPNKPIKIQHGCKISRTLGKIAEAFHVPGFEDFRIRHSQLLNQKSLEGTLCLSIHPLDFMTMSDNECGWSSCMSWIEGGCYRQGTVTMMNSPMVIVAYLTAEGDMLLPKGGTWNNKKWRQLFIVNPDIISNVKGYPYKNDNLTLTALEWIKELVGNYFGTQYTQNPFEYDAFRATFNQELGAEFNIEPSTEVMYNDLGKGQWAYLNVKANRVLDFYWSGAAECMRCGVLNPYVDDESLLVCDGCDERVYCDYCDDPYDSDEDFHEVEGQYLCPYCFNEYSDIDVFSGERYLTDNLQNVYVTLDDKILYFIGLQAARYELLQDDHSRYYSAIYNYNHPWEGRSFFRFQDLTAEGRKLLNLPDDIDKCREHLENDCNYGAIKMEDDITFSKSYRSTDKIELYSNEGGVWF